MISKQHIDLRVQKTRKAIKNTFKEMICQMDANKITVKELTDRAKIHRKTFYLHYTCIEALFEDMLQEIVNGYFEEVNKLDSNFDMSKINEIFFKYYSKQEKYVEKLICAPSYRDFCDKLFSVALKHNLDKFNPYINLSEVQQDLINTFLVSSSTEIYRWWVATKKQLTLDEVISLSSNLLNSGVSQYIRSS